jgi:hypothetical protein
VWKLHSAFGNHTRACGNHTRACKNHTLRAKITLVRVEITLKRVFWKIERVLAKINFKNDTHACEFYKQTCYFHTYGYRFLRVDSTRNLLLWRTSKKLVVFLLHSPLYMAKNEVILLFECIFIWILKILMHFQNGKKIKKKYDPFLKHFVRSIYCAFK